MNNVDEQQKGINKENIKSDRVAIICLFMFSILILVYLLLPQAKNAVDAYEGVSLKGYFEENSWGFHEQTSKYGETSYVFIDNKDIHNQFINKDFGNQYAIFKTNTEGRSVKEYLNNYDDAWDWDTCYLVKFKGYPSLYLERKLRLESPVEVYDPNTRFSFMHINATNTRYIVCLSKDRVYFISTYGFVDDSFVKNMENNIDFIDYEKEKIKEITNWSLIALLFILLCIMLYLIIKPLKNRVKNKTAFWIGFYILSITFLSIELLAILIQTEQYSWYGSDTLVVVALVIAHLLLIFLPCFLFVRKKAIQPYQEDFLVPDWFKRKFYSVIKNKSILRLILVFVFYPIYLFLTIPWIGICSLFVIIPIMLILALVFIISWIYKGKSEKI